MPTDRFHALPTQLRLRSVRLYVLCQRIRHVSKIFVMRLDWVHIPNKRQPDLEEVPHFEGWMATLLDQISMLLFCLIVGHAMPCHAMPCLSRVFFGRSCSVRHTHKPSVALSIMHALTVFLSPGEGAARVG